MWVVLDPSLVADGAFPEVRVGQVAAAVLVLEEPVPCDGLGQPVDGAGTITPMPSTPAGTVSARHRVAGMTALRGKRVGVQAAGIFALLEGETPPPGRPFDAVADLCLTTWLVPRSARSGWLVRDIVLHTAPVPVLEQAAAPGAQPRSGTRLMTGQQYLDAVGSQNARARGVWVRAGAPDYAAGEQQHVEQALALGRDPVGTARRYLLDVVPAPTGEHG
jgi:hypothetical protein